MAKNFTIMSELAPLYELEVNDFGRLLKDVGLRNEKGKCSQLAIDKGIGENKKHPEKKYEYQLWNRQKLIQYLVEEHGIKTKVEIFSKEPVKHVRKKFDRTDYELAKKKLEEQGDSVPWDD